MRSEKKSFFQAKLNGVSLISRECIIHTLKNPRLMHLSPSTEMDTAFASALLESLHPFFELLAQKILDKAKQDFSIEVDNDAKWIQSCVESVLGGSTVPASAVQSRRSGRGARTETKPKRTATKSAWNNYCKAMMTEMKKDNPDLKFGTASKMLSANWKNMTAEDKAKYKTVMEENDLQEVSQHLTFQEDDTGDIPNKAFSKFKKEMLREFESSSKIMTLKTKMRLISEKWANLKRRQKLAYAADEEEEEEEQPLDTLVEESEEDSDEESEEEEEHTENEILLIRQLQTLSDSKLRAYAHKELDLPAKELKEMSREELLRKLFDKFKP